MTLSKRIFEFASMSITLAPLRWSTRLRCVLTSDVEVTRMALVPGLREGVAVVPFVFLAVLNELLPRRVAGVDERDGVFHRVESGWMWRALC